MGKKAGADKDEVELRPVENVFFFSMTYSLRNTLKTAKHLKSDEFEDVGVKSSSWLTESCNGLCCYVNIYRKILGGEGQFKDGLVSPPDYLLLQRIPFRWLTVPSVYVSFRVESSVCWVQS